jgi:hypothetical protein
VWTKKLEELVLKFITLCVELNRPGKAKDALFAFRVVATQQPQSFENVLRHFILESERQAEYVFPQVVAHQTEMPSLGQRIRYSRLCLTLLLST